MGFGMMMLGDATVFDSTLTAISTGISSNITTILPVAGGLFALMFGIKLIPRLIKSFTRG